MKMFLVLYKKIKNTQNAFTLSKTKQQTKCNNYNDKSEICIWIQIYNKSNTIDNNRKHDPDVFHSGKGSGTWDIFACQIVSIMQC